MIRMYGIKNCDTIKKARAWLDERGIAYEFHDYKVEGVDRERLSDWMQQLGWERVLNRAGTTFRRLPERDRERVDASRALELMAAQPSMIKRPLIEHDRGVLLGFDPKSYVRQFG